MFRMHAVVLKEPLDENYILCHIRRLNKFDDENDVPKPYNKVQVPLKRKREPLAPLDNGIHALMAAVN